MRRRRVGAILAVPALALIAAACGKEHFPAPLGASDASAPSVVPVDAAADAPLDAEPVDAADDADDADAEGGAADGGDDGGACDVRLDNPPVVASPHVPEGTPIAYTSNPPSSGPHYPVWANFQEYTHPVDDGYLVHSMEHGAVLFLYKCADDGGACADMVAALRSVRDAVPTDPTCDPSIRVRVILAPRPANDVAVAAAAWGSTYRADCVDARSLAAFVAAHYAKAPENFCSAGMVF